MLYTLLDNYIINEQNYLTWPQPVYLLCWDINLMGGQIQHRS